MEDVMKEHIIFGMRLFDEGSDYLDFSPESKTIRISQEELRNVIAEVIQSLKKTKK